MLRKSLQHGIMALLLGAACGASLPGCPTNKDAFRITGPTGLTVVTFDYMGTVQTNGPIATGVAAGSPNLSENADKNEFLVKNPGGTVVARVDGATGNLYLKGQLIHDADLALTPDPEFAVCDANGTAQVIIDTQGNLKYRGRIGMVMTREVSSTEYQPCGTLEVTLTLYYYDVATLRAAGVVERLPEGWTYKEWLGTGDAPDIAPSAGTEAPEFAWVDPPDFPVTLEYRVNIPGNAQGDQAISGNTLHRTSGAEVMSRSIYTPLTEGTPVEGECGEGEGEGERGGSAPMAPTGGGGFSASESITKECDAIHSADTDQDQLISLSEVLRVVQFFNSDGFHCETGTEDGYAPGSGDTTCATHDSDYNPQDWSVNLSALLRVIQFYNGGGYLGSSTEGTEDGFKPGSGAAPVIVLLGADPAWVEIGADYVDAGANVTDDCDTGLEVTINDSDVDTTLAGAYTVYFSVTDSHQNVTTTERRIKVTPKMEEVSAGVFMMGRRGDDHGNADEGPIHQVELDAYRIGKYEVTNEEYARFLNWALTENELEDWSGNPYSEGDVYLRGMLLLDIDEGANYPYTQIIYDDGDEEFQVITREGNDMSSHPVVKVSWFGAVAYCNWLSQITDLDVCCLNRNRSIARFS